ncbi:MAG TPA: MATE family efflux transporter [Clostridiales bacterium]|nr:MATE family efflux transporter [Clostridiales bacterium]
MNATKDLESKSIGSLLLQLSVPAVIGMLVNALYSVVDRIFIGRGVGSLALSGVAVTFPITNIIMAVGMLIGIGAASVVSIKLGQRKLEDAEHIVGNALLLTIILSLIITALGLIFLHPLLKVLGASPETMPYAKTFATLLLSGAVLQNVGFGLNPIIRSQGDAKTAMKTMLIGAILNTILNPVFIFIFKLGVAGSALATLISQAVCSVWVVYYLSSKSIIKLKRKYMRLHLNTIAEITSIGVSPFFMQVSASFVTIVINTSLVKYGGDLAVGAYSLVSSIAMLILMPAFGVNQGAQPIIGYNFGAKNAARVKKALLYSIIVNTCITAFGWLMVQLFPVPIIKIFNGEDTELIRLASNGLRLYLLAIFTVGAQSACINYFQSIGKALVSMVLSLLRQVIILIPLVLILPHYLALNGIWIAGSISDISAVVISAAMLVLELRKLKASSLALAEQG